MISYFIKIVTVLLCFSVYCTAQFLSYAALDGSIANYSGDTTEAVSSAGSQHSIKCTLIYSAGAVATTAILLHYDQKIYDGLYKWKNNNKIVKDISPVITNLGDGRASLGLFGGFVGYGLIFENKKAAEVGKIGLESFFLTGAAVQILKYLAGRERPSCATRPGGFWAGPLAFFRQPDKSNKGVSSFDAFPSGHTATAFAAATTISDFYTYSWVSYTSYSLATIVAISRVTESTHWLSDCFVGAIIGYYGTRIIEKLNYGSTDLTITPWANASSYGLILSLKI